MKDEGQNGDEVTSEDGREWMFGLDFGNFDVSGAADSETDENNHEESKSKRNATVEREGILSYDPALVDKLLLLEDKLPCASEEDFVDLFAWATQEGADLGGICCRQDNHNGRGLYSTRPCLTGGLLATLPRSLRIGQSFAQKKLGLPLDTPDLSALTLLVLWFCQREHIYAKCLPRKEQFTNALLMTREEQIRWSDQLGPEYGEAIRNAQSRAQACEAYIRNYLSSCHHRQEDQAEEVSSASYRSTLKWAISMVKSRSHAFGSKRGYWLTPVFDLVNHSPEEPNARLEGDSTGFLAMRSLRDIAAGEEITIDYQVDEDPQLVANYGFSLRGSNRILEES